MANRDEVLNNFLRNPMLEEICNLTSDDLKEASFASPANDPLIDALRRLIISVVEKDDTTLASVKAVNATLKSIV